MANFKQVNKAVKNAYPELNVEVVRGSGYIYFKVDGELDVLESIYANPTTTDTDDMIRMCLEEVEWYLNGK